MQSFKRLYVYVEALIKFSVWFDYSLLASDALVSVFIWIPNGVPRTQSLYKWCPLFFDSRHN